MHVLWDLTHSPSCLITISYALPSEETGWSLSISCFALMLFQMWTLLNCSCVVCKPQANHCSVYWRGSAWLCLHWRDYSFKCVYWACFQQRELVALFAFYIKFIFERSKIEVVFIQILSYCKMWMQIKRIIIIKVIIINIKYYIFNPLFSIFPKTHFKPKIVKRSECQSFFLFCFISLLKSNLILSLSIAQNFQTHKSVYTSKPIISMIYKVQKKTFRGQKFNFCVGKNTFEMVLIVLHI